MGDVEGDVVRSVGVVGWERWCGCCWGWGKSRAWKCGFGEVVAVGGVAVGGVAVVRLSEGDTMVGMVLLELGAEVDVPPSWPASFGLGRTSEYSPSYLVYD
jgi:hypothetical protein